MELEERLKHLENLCHNNTQRRLLDTHYSGQLFNYLVQSGVVPANKLQQEIHRIGESIKDYHKQDPYICQITNEHTAQWLSHIEDSKPSEFILSGGVS